MSKSPSKWPARTALVALGLLLGRFVGGSSPGLLAITVPQAPPASASNALTLGVPTPDPEEEAYRLLALQYEGFRGVEEAFQLVSKTVSPSVVHIVARKTGEDEKGRRARFEETGSGVIVRLEDSPVRYVLTNNHVVEGARPEDVSIHLLDGRVVRPAEFWADLSADVAVLRLDRTDLPAARMGDSDQASVGTWVLAIGSPFGLTHSVSQGIISARGRYEAELEADGVENQDFLQTDAAINPGNSGGPLVNLKGEVVGINTAIASNGGGSEGVGFSIPINLARWAMTQLVHDGRVSRGGIGVHLADLDPRLAARLGLDRPRGARIESVQDASPAAEAGIRRGDVILAYNGIDVHDFNHFINLVSMTRIGEVAELQVWRAGQPLLLRIQIADRSRVLAPSPPSPRPSGDGER